MSGPAGSLVIDWEALTPLEQSELYVIAGGIHKNEFIDESRLAERDFYNPRFGETWELMRQMRASGHVVDPISLGHREPGREAFFWELTSLPHFNYEYHEALVHEGAVRRNLQRAALQVKTLAEDMATPLSDIEDAARAAVDAAVSVAPQAVTRSGDVAASVIQNIGFTEPGFRTPWPKLSRAIRGFRRGKLVLIAARPAVGKSVIALQCAAGMEYAGHVGFVSLEMGREEIVKRLITQQSEIAYTLIDGDHELPDFARERVEQWHAGYEGKLLINDVGGLTVAELRAQIRTWKREHPDLVAVVVDYLQLMDSSQRWESQRVQAVGEISRALKKMSIEFDLVIIACSQLNRGPEQRADKVPMLSDLRESGSLEQDADIVILLNRDMSLSQEAVLDEIDLIIAKNRQGPTGKVTLEWQGDFMRAVGGGV